MFVETFFLTKRETEEDDRWQDREGIGREERERGYEREGGERERGG